MLGNTIGTKRAPQDRNENTDEITNQDTIALFGGAAALAIALGGGIAAATDTTLATGPTNHSVNVAPAVPAPAAQPTAADPAGVQRATLVGCIGA